MRIAALGPIEAVSDKGVANLGGPKPRTLLAALALEPGRVVSVERLVDLVWDDNPPQTAASLVHTYVSSLRRGFAAVGDQRSLATRAPGYALDVDPEDVDLVRFARHLREASRAERAGDEAGAARGYREALEEWRGLVAFDGVPARFARVRADSLQDDRLSAEEGLARCNLALGRVAAVVSRMTAVSAAHPLREEARALLMQALYLSGRRGDALAVFRDGREHLVAELGVEPGTALRQVHAQILDGTYRTTGSATATLTKRPAPEVRPRVVPNQLPPDLADFVGRREQVDRVLALARDGERSAVRVVVVSGAGGAGKSTLAVRCAHVLSRSYPDGQLFVNLREAGRTVDSRELLGRFLRALGAPSADLPDSEDERAELYRMTTATKRLIIVLDDVRAEHQVRRLLPASGHSLVLITSRSRLTGLAGATPVELGLLSVEASVEMLRRIIGDERVDAEPEVAASIARLCGGIPLAIRVAGAKLLARAHWPLSALAARLSHEHRRLDELSVGDLALRASLEVGYAELDGRQRRLFHLLALLDLPDFGAWLAAPLLDIDLEGAEDVVEELVDLRLLDVMGVDVLGRIRYSFHDLVQLFGVERAEREEPADVVADALRRALLTWMALVETSAARLPRVTVGLTPPVRAGDAEVDPRLTDEAAADPMGWLTSETKTIVRAVERGHDLGIDELSTTLIAAMLSSPFAVRNEFDGWQRTHRAALDAAVRSGDRTAEATVRAGLGQLFYERDDFAASLEQFTSALEIATAVGERAIEGVAHLGIGTVLRDLGRLAQARESLTAAIGSGDPGVVVAAEYGLGAILRDQGDLDAATTALGRCVELYRELGDVRGEALALRGLSLCHRATGDLARAGALSRQAHAILVGVDDVLGATYALQSAAKADFRAGRTEGVAATLESCRDVCARHKDRFGVALTTRTLGEFALARGDAGGAAALLSEALDLWRELRLPVWEARTLRDLAAATVATDAEAAREQWARATALAADLGLREREELADLTPQRWRERVSRPLAGNL
ncbi:MULTISPECIES: AfsR/SARP family transcriptional regulator [unclassified Saccharothrix]|uniref:AfsR/SARP family transcriptional regulator n=1 Tax=unclassified Saccharothrix TaxID=2593673 RepID=UPI00307D0C29